MLPAAMDSPLQLWDAATGKRIRVLTGHRATIEDAVFSADGKTILSGAGDKTARLWDVATGLGLGPPVQHDQGAYVVPFSSDATTFLSGSGAGITRHAKVPLPRAVQR